MLAFVRNKYYSIYQTSREICDMLIGFNRAINEPIAGVEAINGSSRVIIFPASF